MTLWCLVSAPLLLGNDLSKLDEFTLNVLENDEVLAVSQDSLGKQASTLSTDGYLRVLAKDLDDGTKAVGLFNTDSNSAAAVKIKWSDLNISGKKTVRDLWRQKDLGKFSDEFSMKVAPHSAELLKIGNQ